MKVFGSISRLVSILFRKDGQDIALKPNQSTTYSAARSFELPVGDSDHELVGKDSVQTLSNKSLDGDSNSFSNIGISSLKTELSDADKVVLRDVSGAIVSSKLSNKHIASDAAIDLSKLASVTASKVLVSDSSGKVSASSISNVELGYLSGVSSNVQSQLDSKASQADMDALTTDDIAEGSNLYFTDERAKSAAVKDSGFVGDETDVAPSVREVFSSIQNLTDAINNEASTREQDDDTLSADIATETAARISADSALQTAIDNEVSARQSAVSSEATTRANADSALQAEIDAEEVARAQGDATLQSNIDDEESARISGDQALQSELDASQLGAGLGTDGSYSPKGDANYISAASSLKDADNKLDAALKVEELARISGDSSTLQSAKDYADAQISALVDGAPGVLDTLNELAAAIGDDENFITTIQSQISSEATARQAADSTLQGNIDQEVSDRQSADSALQDQIDALNASAAQDVSDLADEVDLKLNKPVSGDEADKYLRSNGDGSTYWDQGYVLPVYKTNWISSDGQSKSVTHNLGSTDVQISLVDLEDGQQIGVDSISIVDGNTVSFSSSEAPGASGWRVLIQKL